MVHTASGGEIRHSVDDGRQADTICAMATPSGQGGVAVVRVSGRRALAVAEAVAGPLPAAREAALRRFRDAAGEVLDQGLVLVFKAPASYTGEDVVELQGHGSPAAVGAILGALCAAGARPAGPGEFSERAFLNGRLDLTQAEAVASLIEAETDSARRAALRALSGAFGQRVDRLGERMLELRAHVEAFLDFPDDEDVPADPPELGREVRGLLGELEEIRRRASAGVRLGDGMRVVLIGPPNAGKSSLLNGLSGEEAAIVSGRAGTTRDVVRQRAVIGARRAELLDTAGLRRAEEQDEIEAEGARRARAAAAEADLLLVVVEAGGALDGELRERLEAQAPGPAVVVWNKIDETGEAPGWEEGGALGGHVSVARVSARTGAGMEAFRDGLESLVAGEAGDDAWAARQRHLDALDRAAGELEEALGAATRGGEEELVAEALRRAQSSLGEITGRVSHEALLDRIFSGFCIGK
ncbi:MAG: tRNA uridine-5-carboxymethylaminomethyl(34) synthesis GTPase MnmE [Halorhodospira halophila]|uniref:tRNA uridine-5-carboxymethylaminomethyl(34) synthesis GTPase MnmE n=1 Tax=Halorhodospira TaxID=85108 RepID=UPI00191221E9|nr:MULTISPECIES: tRNA uridine-5-carboxymethylaminomethyl(34) synthesis GTPase MnmE [Halorhodospira]MBK5943587.1 tRNA uridine-5-carboxymethylaminomethyl(34) synthesis GTPase MnmE [Halorhodospira halophila]MCC3750931.1 tRNA uridine-5-carboxymethylaminomethyl(34) synthesis GTPase MnmE [Halorhodospira halophila]